MKYSTLGSLAILLICLIVGLNFTVKQEVIVQKDVVDIVNHSAKYALMESIDLDHCSKTMGKAGHSANMCELKIDEESTKDLFIRTIAQELTNYYDLKVTVTYAKETPPTLSFSITFRNDLRFNFFGSINNGYVYENTYLLPTWADLKSQL